ncbi:MAG: response regulator [Burkholderiaceae bacterium]
MPNQTPTPPSMPRVLVVDDNVDAAESLALVLECEGFDVACVHDGLAALHWIERERPQAVLLDLGLPSIDGLEVARRVRAGPLGQDVLLIAVSGYGRDEDHASTRAAGFDAHLVKPVPPDAILEMLGSRLAC